MYSIKEFNPETCEWTTKVYNLTAEKAVEMIQSFERLSPPSKIFAVFSTSAL